MRLQFNLGNTDIFCNSKHSYPKICYVFGKSFVKFLFVCSEFSLIFNDYFCLFQEKCEREFITSNFYFEMSHRNTYLALSKDKFDIIERMEP